MSNSTLAQNTADTPGGRRSTAETRERPQSKLRWWRKQNDRDTEMQSSAADDPGTTGASFETNYLQTNVRVRTSLLFVLVSYSLIMQIPVDDLPNGYPRLSAFLGSDQNVMLFRGFACVHTRLLLHLQADIQMLEQELDEYDAMHDGETRLRSWDVDAAKCRNEKAQKERTRQDILEELRVKISHYGRPPKLKPLMLSNADRRVDDQYAYDECIAEAYRPGVQECEGMDSEPQPSCRRRAGVYPSERRHIYTETR